MRLPSSSLKRDQTAAVTKDSLLESSSSTLMDKTGFYTRTVKLSQLVKLRMTPTKRKDSSGLTLSSLPKSELESQESWPIQHISTEDSTSSLSVQSRPPEKLLTPALTPPREPSLISMPITRFNRCGTRNGATSNLTPLLDSILVIRKSNNKPTSGS